MTARQAEKGLWMRMRRRAGSPRGNAFMEFAIIAPLLLMMISAIFEFTAFWDAKIMANHAAWVCARSASVAVGMQAQSNETFKVNGLVTRQMRESTAFLMSTCQMGKFATAEEITDKYIKEKLTKVLKKLKTSIEDKIKDGLGKLAVDISGMFDGVFDSSGGLGSTAISLLKKLFNGDSTSDGAEKAVDGDDSAEGIIGTIIDCCLGASGGGKSPTDELIKVAIQKIVEPLLTKLFDPLIQTLSDKVVSVVNKVIPFDKIESGLDFVEGKNRTVRGLSYALRRSLYMDGIITIKEDPGVTNQVSRDVSFEFSKSHGEYSFGNDSRLDFPLVQDKSAKLDDSGMFIAKASPWPANNQVQRMISVKIAWPFERAWMFPVISGWTTAKESLKNVPTAVGYAMAYPQPKICDENLLSDGAEAYAPGTTPKVDEFFKDFKDKYTGYMQMVAFGCRYRLADEQFGPYDSDTNIWHSGSLKGIGLYQGEDRDPSAKFFVSLPDKKLYYQAGGLVLWMGIVDATNKVLNAHRDDYNRDFEAITGTSNQHTPFWFGFPFVFGAKILPPLSNLLSVKAAHDDDWFYWDEDPSYRDRLHYRYTLHWNPYQLAALATATNAPQIVQDMAFNFPEGKAASILGVNAHLQIMRLIAANADQISKAFDDTSRSGSAASSSMFDFDGTDDDIVKDPTNAVKRMYAYLDQLEKKGGAKLREIDQAILDLESAEKAAMDAYKNGGKDNPGSLVSVAQRVKDAYDKCYQLEFEYGQIHNLSNNNFPARREEMDLGGMLEQKIDPRKPGASSADSGSDDDKAGESWTYQPGSDGQRGTWQSDGKGSDVIPK